MYVLVSIRCGFVAPRIDTKITTRAQKVHIRLFATAPWVISHLYL